MNTPSKAASTATQTTMSACVGPQTDELMRERDYYRYEFTCLLRCFGELTEDNRRLRRKNRSLKSLLVNLLPLQ